MLQRFAFLLELSWILACPVCDSATGAQVREGIFNVDFAQNLVGILLPGLVLGAIVAAVHLTPSRRPAHHGTVPASEESGR
jgi:hypothetical protein